MELSGSESEKMKGKKVFVIVIWLLFWCRGLFAFTSGIPATSTIKNVYITGTGPTEDSQFYNWQVSSLTWNGSFWEGTVSLVPGNTYYYKYIIEYETRGTTETVWEQKDELRSIYISPDDRVFLDGDFENSYTVSEIFDNWAGSPPPPQISNIDVNSGQAVVYIKKPTFGNREIIDLKGYLIYLSTDKVNWINYNDTSTLVSSNRTQIELKGLQNNTTYFLKIRSVDRYDYGVIDINSPYYPDSTLKRKYPWLYSEVVSFRPDRRVFCEFSLEYFGNETVFLNINGKKIKMKKKGEKYIASVKLINNESYSYQYETQNLTDPQGERNIKISDIDGDGKFYIDDVWGVGISFEVPFEIIGWQVSSSTGEISFSWKKNPQHEGEITIFYSSDKYNWNVLVTTSSQNYTWKNFMTGATYYFSIGSFKNQSSPCQVLAGSTSFFKNPPPLKITKIFEGIEASDFRDSLKILSSPKNFDKKFSDFLIFYSTYNIEISTGTNFDWQIYDFLSKKKGFSPNSPMIYANLPSTTPLKAFYIRGAGFLEDNSGVYCTQPDVFVTPALIEYKKQKTFSRDKVSVSFGKYSLPVKKAYLTFYKYEEIEVSQKFKQIREKITQAIENSLKISFQSFISTEQFHILYGQNLKIYFHFILMRKMVSLEL